MNFDNFQEKKALNLIIKFIKEKVGKGSVCIGLSGGIDSTLVCEMAIMALGPKRVKGIVLVNDRYSKESLNWVKEYVKRKKIKLEEIDTKDLKKFTISILPKNAGLIQKATADARVCDLIIKTKACIDGLIYLGTINGTERITGWYPKGDLVGDFCPIGGLLKEHEKKIAKMLGLSNLIETVSEDARRVCSGCGDLEEFNGIKYRDLDYILYMIETEHKNNHKKILNERKIPLNVYNTILKRIKKEKHKLDVFPLYPIIYKINEK